MRTFLLLALLASTDASRRGRAIDPLHCGLLRSTFPNTGIVRACKFSPDGSRLVVAGDSGRIATLRSGSWAHLESQEQPFGAVCALKFSPDGRSFAAGTGLGLWVFPEKGPPRDFRIPIVYGVAWSPEGDRLAAVGEEGMVRLLANGKETAELKGHTSTVTACVFTPDGKSLVTTGRDGTLRIFEVGSGRCRAYALNDVGTSSVALSRDGGRIYTGGADDRGSIREIEFASGKLLRRAATGAGESVAALRMMPDGRHLVVASGLTVQLWDTARLQCVAVLRHHTAQVLSLAVSPGGRWIVSGGADYQIKVWGHLPGGMAKVRPKGFFGVRVQDLEDGSGVLVVEVIGGCAAAGAGVQVGDVIRKVGGQKVASSAESIAAIGSFFVGEEVEFTILRGGGEITVTAKLGRRPDSEK